MIQRHFLVLLVVVAALCGNLKSQTADNQIIIGERIKIFSNILNEERALLISLPNRYAVTGDRYQVLYLLDGDSQFRHVTGIIDFLSGQGLIPPMIVVGIANTDRARDFTPEAAADTLKKLFPTSGGAGSFLNFLTDELIPHIDKSYRTNSFRILQGYSFGGLFCMYAFTRHPSPFNAYISISPSLGWNNRQEVQNAEALFQKQSELKKFLYITLGDEGANPDQIPYLDYLLDYPGSLGALNQVLSTKAPKGLVWKYDPLPKETHGSIPHRATYNALEFMYEGWNGPANQAAATLSDYETHYNILSAKFGYPIDMPELLINLLGYRLLQQKRVAEAITAFKYNIKKYPNSANVYDSMGDGYEAGNKLKLAKLNVEIAVKMGIENKDPNLNAYQQHLNNLLKRIKQ